LLAYGYEVPYFTNSVGIGGDLTDCVLDLDGRSYAADLGYPVVYFDV
jgi:hypothetical protein